MNSAESFYASLRTFAQAVNQKLSQTTIGEPEDQLRGPFEVLVNAISQALNYNLICVGETSLPDRLGRPDFAIHLDSALVGYIELKAPGSGANQQHFRGHNREQFKRFAAIPNILYTDGDEWAIYRNGELVGSIVRLTGSITNMGAAAVTQVDAVALLSLFRDYLTWEPLVPTDSKGRVDLRQFASLLAPITGMLRNDVAEALSHTSSPIVQLASDWRQLLFPDASDSQFADSYAQTVAFALLLGRSEGADPLTLVSAKDALATQHSLLSRALEVLTDPEARSEMKASLDLLLRIIGAIPIETFEGSHNRWIYFYEDFLAVYDPALRRDAGAYYTPIEVVRCQVRLVHDLLTTKLGKPKGFADPDVLTLDPATGTGTYLLGVIDHALKTVEATEGLGAVPGQATSLANNLYGFEMMVGPFAVTELRVSRAIRDSGGILPKSGMNIYLADTLESPNATPHSLGLFFKPIADQHARAIEVKKSVPVIVCIGNPPYDRHQAATSTNKSRTGGWVRWGDKQSEIKPIFQAFTVPAKTSGLGVHVKNLYNLYVYFWSWAIWKVFEQSDGTGPGVISYISASSYLDGDAFCGMREHLRRQCDDIWVLDLGGEGRGTRQEDNVFAIQTPVAICIASRAGNRCVDKPANVRYARIEGSRAAKLDALDSITSLNEISWEDCPQDWQAAFRPVGKGQYFTWPSLLDLFPWQHSGAQFKRTWPISFDAAVLASRWNALLASPDRANAFRETRDRKISSRCQALLEGECTPVKISELKEGSLPPKVHRYSYRAFDRQWAFADSRFGDFLRPVLWRTLSDAQVFLTTLTGQPIGSGPAVVATSLVPDLHHFRGSYGAKDVLPLYRDSRCTESNVLPGLLEFLSLQYGKEVSSSNLLAYVYAILAQPGYSSCFEDELDSRELRVPLTRDSEIFHSAVALGERLLWLHTFGERFVPEGFKRGVVPQGQARCVIPVAGDAQGYPEIFVYDGVSRTLRVGDGEFSPVSPEVYSYEVSGLKVVHSWLSYRSKSGAGKKSSPLDDIRSEVWKSSYTTELLELLWLLEATVEQNKKQADLLEAVLAGGCFEANELPSVPDSARLAPKVATDEVEQGSFFADE